MFAAGPVSDQDLGGEDPSIKGTMDYIREIELTSVTLHIPAGNWLAVSPFESPVSGGITALRVPAGVSSYFDDEGRRLAVSNDGDGRVRVAISPPD